MATATIQNDDLYLAQTGDNYARERLLKAHMVFIRMVGASVCGRQLSFQDDEMSICIIAFNQALDRYRHDTRVPFKSYAAVVIRSRLIDYLRRENRHRHFPLELPCDNQLEDTYSPAEVQEALRRYREKVEAQIIRSEIVQLAQILDGFKITWLDLLHNCPKHQRKRRLCLEAALRLVGKKDLWNYFWKNKMLPVKRLTEEMGVTRRTIEGSRKYIVTVALIIYKRQEFPLLYEYIKDELGHK